MGSGGVHNAYTIMDRVSAPVLISFGYGYPSRSASLGSS